MSLHYILNKNAKNTFNNPTDKIYTPENIALLAINQFKLYGKVLDPFRGKGAFYNNLPNNIEKDWCEIDENRNFYDYNKKVDWIISNPPYSDYTNIINHSYKIADNIVYLMPLSKIFSSLGRIKDLNNYGGIVSLYIISASRCKFPFGFPACIVYFKRNYHGPIEWILDKESL